MMEMEICPHTDVLADEIITNFDGSIDHKVGEQLKVLEACGAYPGWDFYGHVWWNKSRKQWSCEIRQYYVHVNTIHADTLEGLREAICNLYGSD